MKCWGLLSQWRKDAHMIDLRPQEVWLSSSEFLLLPTQDAAVLFLATFVCQREAVYTSHRKCFFHPMKPNNSRLITSVSYHFLCPMVYLMKPVTGGPLGQSVTIFDHYQCNYFFMTANRWRMKSQHIPAVGEKKDSRNFHLCIVTTNGWLSRNFLLGFF